MNSSFNTTEFIGNQLLDEKQRSVNRETVNKEIKTRRLSVENFSNNWTSIKFLQQTQKQCMRNKLKKPMKDVIVITRLS